MDLERFFQRLRGERVEVSKSGLPKSKISRLVNPNVDFNHQAVEDYPPDFNDIKTKGDDKPKP